MNLISEGTLIKAFYLPNKTLKKKSETQFGRNLGHERQLKTIMPI